MINRPLQTCLINNSVVLKDGFSTSTPPHPAQPLNKKVGVVFANSDCISRICFNYSQHLMLAICILFSTVTMKTYSIYM